MSESIKIISIKFENYRQYFGSHNVEFPNRDEGFSVIVGENGSGKSNILNAINWCFYKKEPHTKKDGGYSIINEKYLESIKDGNISNMSVQIEIQKGKDHYRISRVLKVIKNEYQYENTDSKKRKMTEVHGYPLPVGCEVDEHQSTFEILIKKEHEQDFHLDRKTPPDIIMNEILPESLSSYFILDGEFLEKFWSGIHQVRIGIEQISQLHTITSTMTHLKSFRKNIPVLGDKDIDNLTAKIVQMSHFEESQDVHGVETFTGEPRYGFNPETDTNEFYHATGIPRIKDIDDDIRKMKNELEEITRQFGSSNIESVKILNNEEKEIKEQYSKLSDEEQRFEKEYFSSLIENTPMFFLKSAIKHSVDIVDGLREKGNLPYEAKKIFTNDLLERGTCICHTDLKSDVVNGKEANDARLEVMKIRDNMEGDQGLDISVGMKFHFEEQMLGDFNKFTDTVFDIPRKNFSNAKDAAQKCNVKLKEINIKLQNVGHEDIEKLAKNHSHLIGLIEEKTKEIEDIKYRLKNNAQHARELVVQRNTLLGKNIKTKQIEHEQNIWNNLFTIFEKTYSELRMEIKNEVQTKTMEIFLKTMYKEDLFKEFIIKDNFEVELIDQKRNPLLKSLSAGESLFLALSFISAIRNVTGFKFPLVIDTPLGKVSGTPRYLLSQALPKYLPDEQIIFLATDTEFLNPDRNVHDVEGRPELAFGELLEQQITVKYYLIKGMEKNIAQIVDYIPKWRIN